MKQIKKQDAIEAVHAALESLFEAAVLRSVVSDDDLDETQIEVLSDIAGERASNAFDAVNFVHGYLEQKPKKAKRKLAVVKKAA